MVADRGTAAVRLDEEGGMAESTRFLPMTLPVAAVLPCPEDAT